MDAGAAVPPVFRMRDLIRIYKGRDVAVHALPGVDFVVVSAEFVIRPDTSGSGTSTCRKIIDGPDLVSHGSVAFRERNPDCMRVRATRWPYLRRPSPCHAQVSRSDSLVMPVSRVAALRQSLDLRAYGCVMQIVATSRFA